MELYALALLPFALLSLFEKGNHRSTAGFGFLAALAPVIAKGIGSLISHKQNKSAAKQAEEQRKLEAQQADAASKAQWEAQQNSPAAQAARFKNTLQLGRLYGAMGGQDKVPPSIAKYYQTMRSMPEYGGVSSYVPQAQKGGTGWDIAAGVADSLQYLDYNKLKNQPKSGGVLSGFGAGSSFGNENPAPAAPSNAPFGAGLNIKRLAPGGLVNPTFQDPYSD